MDIINIYEKYFSKDIRNIFSTLSEIAFENEFEIYLIGGLVRDMLLNMPSLDIDISVKGNAIDFANVLANKNIATIKSIHKDFGTAKIVINNTEIDIASTRSEIYPQENCLPVVTEIGCELKKDILRRDFTINSIALSLNKNNFLEIIDYVNGLNDLENKKMRILHKKSFYDDPTRIIRGLKYSNRLGFSLEEETKNLQIEYLENINFSTGYKRILQEFKKTFSSKKPPYNEFIKQNIYKLLTAKKPKIYDIPDKDFSWIVYFYLITENNIENFDFSKKEKEIFDAVQFIENIDFNTDVEIYKAFCNLPQESIDILQIKKNKFAQRYVNSLSEIKISLTGQDLIDLGCKPSKKFAEVFDFILSEKIKRANLTKEEEINLAKQFFI